MSTYQIYNKTTGLLTGRVIVTTSTDLLKQNIPYGHGVIMGMHDHQSKRVDLRTNEVVDYVPPKPSEFHEWDAYLKRWVYTKQIDDFEKEVRDARNYMIAQTDWMALRESESEPMPREWKEYRQALRDITKQVGFPMNVEWPEIPK